MKNAVYMLFNKKKSRFAEWTNDQGECRGPLLFSDLESAHAFVQRLGKATKGYTPLAKLMSEITARAQDFGWTHIWTRESVPLTERSIFRGVPISLNGGMPNNVN